MTVIEFFDVDDIENIVSTLLCKPDEIVFIGDDEKKMKRSVSCYAKIAAGRDIFAKFSIRTINKNNLMDIVSALSQIVEESENCAIDLTGGEDLYLVAVGMIYKRYSDKVQLHRFNIRNGRLYDCDADGKIIASEPAKISVEENVLAYGGRIIYDYEKNGTTRHWNFSDDFVCDINSMWSVCRLDPSGWNKQINTLDGINAYFMQKDRLSIIVDKSVARETLSKRGIKYACVDSVLEKLERKNLILNLENNEQTLSFRFKNKQVKNCLTRAGLLLELFVCVSAMKITYKNSSETVYNDVMTGVVIDWDGLVRGKLPDVENEMDVILMKGLVPVFISCKNGSVEMSELYKLETVATRFGGKYAKKVLVATELDRDSSKGQYIILRANEMGIKVVDDIETMTTEKLERTIRAFGIN